MLVVTATRREESLKDIAATISAVTADQLEASGPIQRTGDLLRTMSRGRRRVPHRPDSASLIGAACRT